MTTLYRPVLIESAEQAEALPVGAIALDDAGPGGLGSAFQKVDASRWYFTTIESDWLTNTEVVGLKLLVPVEAELEQEHIVTATGERLKTHYIARWQED